MQQNVALGGGFMLKAVMCGCGAMAKGWLKAISSTPSLRETVEVVGFVDLNLDMAKALAEEFGLTSALCGTDLQTVLQQTHADIMFDIVVPAARRTVVDTALRNGCHVLSEKPMAVSMEDARYLLALAKECGKIHAIVQNRRFIAGVRSLKAAIASGIIGDLTGLHCDFFIGAHFGGFREDMDNVLLLDMAIHTFDAARFMAGKQPLAVYCYETNPQGSWYRTGSSANAIFELSDNVTFTYRGSWCAEGANTSWESQWRIIGTKGTILWDGEDTFTAHHVTGDTGFFRDLEPLDIPPPPSLHETHGHASVIDNFISAILSSGTPETVSQDNIKSLAMVFGAIESAATRTRVNIAH
jgi:predicted dehydrogenase